MADFAESSHACRALRVGREEGRKGGLSPNPKSIGRKRKGERCSTIDRSLRRIDEDLSTIGFGGSLAELLPRFCSRRGELKASASGTSGMRPIMEREKRTSSPLHLSLFWHTLRRESKVPIVMVGCADCPASLSTRSRHGHEPQFCPMCHATSMNCVVYPLIAQAGHWSITKLSRGSGEESLEPSASNGHWMFFLPIHHPVIADWPSRMWPCDPPACHQKCETWMAKWAVMGEEREILVQAFLSRERRDVAELRYSVRQSTIADGVSWGATLGVIELLGSAQKEPSPWEELKSALDAFGGANAGTDETSAGIGDERRGLCADERGVAYRLLPMGGHASLVSTLTPTYTSYFSLTKNCGPSRHPWSKLQKEEKKRKIPSH
ncbi:uncharacterized protein BO96DRAFT_332524 [Aspergillus niger CBS 101883]|uniref:Contig An08c0100, genomic contig n=3 Tax=Aspergillus niger TaxID=5061 RepID=A2QQH7_ASPNC|nr:uncharacterized protein BO96DRAFT_332524 [Aspergillus niger CBS 101883]XP_059603917.1 uncharacterized protein An08g02570 [Aspergillus niger]PYH59133.1 hypothetical protein BO96DRAFT_332524 [Aspergillus niger CBS 101883]RDH18415.1 hypothetical protein M747DRAFT_283367 [Aspergillus niger ATCC 13496]CAK45293.1 unnamed protein product [Aspergillus niger]